MEKRIGRVDRCGFNGHTCFLCFERGNFTNGKQTIWDALDLGCLATAKVALAKGAKQVSVANNKNPHDGCTPLCKAAENGHADIMLELIKHGADVNKCATFDKRTPLHAAAEGGNPAAVEILVSHGADLEAVTA